MDREQYGLGQLAAAGQSLSHAAGGLPVSNRGRWRAPVLDSGQAAVGDGAVHFAGCGVVVAREETGAGPRSE
jgi:hypothetical protein